MGENKEVKHKKRYVKKLAVILTATMMLMMQVVTASAVTVVAYSTNWTLKQAEWKLSHSESYITTANYQYPFSGNTENDTPMDSGTIELVILRNSASNAIITYNYGEIISYSDNYVRYGDDRQTGESICNVLLEDNYFGTIDKAVNNY